VSTWLLAGLKKLAMPSKCIAKRVKTMAEGPEKFVKGAK
jgi:hypothetical protein